MLLTPDMDGASEAIILLDGLAVEKATCTAANDDEGWIERIVMHDGRTVMRSDGRGLEIVRLYGRVEIAIPA